MKDLRIRPCGERSIEVTPLLAEWGTGQGVVDGISINRVHVSLSELLITEMEVIKKRGNLDCQNVFFFFFILF